MAKIETCGEYRSLTDEGEIKSFPLYKVTSDKGEVEEGFYTYSAASWWGKMVDDHDEWQDRRAHLLSLQ